MQTVAQGHDLGYSLATLPWAGSASIQDGQFTVKVYDPERVTDRSHGSRTRGKQRKKAFFDPERVAGNFVNVLKLRCFQGQDPYRSQKTNLPPRFVTLKGSQDVATDQGRKTTAEGISPAVLQDLKGWQATSIMTDA
jgi:hypothetical protein